MNNRKFKIKIEEPCTVNKEYFTPTNDGFHCSQCEKCVIDYTGYSTHELAVRLKNGYNTGCGIFTKAQMEKIYEEPNEPKKSKWRYPFFLISSLFMSNNTVSAQDDLNADTLKVAQYPTDSVSIDDTIGEAIGVEDTTAETIDTAIDMSVSSILVHVEPFSIEPFLKSVTSEGMTTMGIISYVPDDEPVEPPFPKPILGRLGGPVDIARKLYAKIIKAKENNQSPKKDSQEPIPHNNKPPIWLSTLVSNKLREEEHTES